MTRFVDYKDRGTCIIFGDGAGAALVEPNYEGLGVIDSYFRTDGTGRKLMHQKQAFSKTRVAQHCRRKGNTMLYGWPRRFKSAVNNMADSVLK